MCGILSLVHQSHEVCKLKLKMAYSENSERGVGERVVEKLEQ